MVLNLANKDNFLAGAFGSLEEVELDDEGPWHRLRMYCRSKPFFCFKTFTVLLTANLAVGKYLIG